MAKSRRPRKSNKIYLWLLPIGLLASGAFYFAFIVNMVDVVVATETINANTEIKSSMITTKRVDKSALPKNYITAANANDLVGLYTNVGITEGSIFTTGNVASEDNKKSAVIPEGQTLLSISITSLPQGITSGDRVNLLIGINTSGGGRSVITYQNIQVTNTYLNDNGDVVGLEVQVTPEQAQYIQYAQLNGELSVSLLPLGYQEENLTPVDESNLEDFDSSISSSSSSSSDEEDNSRMHYSTESDSEDSEE